MANWFYYNDNGEKIGPIRGRDLIQLAKHYVITPETVVENEDGQAVPAKQITGLMFPDTMPSGATPSRAAPVTVEKTLMQSVQSQVNIVPLLPPVSEEDEQDPPQLSRAVFIFLAVFVGIFGVHDFYAKRNKQGRIHLALLLPWILVILISILTVFGYTLYALSFSTTSGTIRNIQAAIKDCEKEIDACMRKVAEKERELAEAMRGKRRIVPQQKVQPDPGREIRPQPDQPDPEREIRPKPDEPIAVVPQPLPQPVAIDEEYVRDLQQELQELVRLLEDLERHLRSLRNDLSDFRAQQGLQRAMAWVSTGPLWLYFFFCVLPLVSWVMAMIEIVYVTRDGTSEQLK